MSYVRIGSVADLTTKAGSAASVPTIDMSDEPEIIPASKPSASDFSAQRRPSGGGAGTSLATIGKSYLPGGANFQAAQQAAQAKRAAASGSNTILGMSPTTLLLLAGAGVGVFLLTRKKGGGSTPAPAGA